MTLGLAFIKTWTVKSFEDVWLPGSAHGGRLNWQQCSRLVVEIEYFSVVMLPTPDFHKRFLKANNEDAAAVARSYQNFDITLMLNVGMKKIVYGTN